MTQHISPRIPTVVTPSNLYALAADGFQRPNNATAYGIGTLIANSATAGSVVPLRFSVFRNPDSGGGSGVQIAAMKMTNGQSGGKITANLHLFDSEPTVTNGDGGAFEPVGDGSTWLGMLSVVTDAKHSAGQTGRGLPIVNNTFAAPLIATLANPPVEWVWGLLEATAAYTPVANEQIAVALELTQT